MGGEEDRWGGEEKRRGIRRRTGRRENNRLF